MSRELADALELDRRLYVRAAEQTAELPEGWAYRHAGLSDVYMLNALRLRAPLSPTIRAHEIVHLADRHLAGLAHRQVLLDDGPAGERLWPEMEARGWERQRTEFMALASDPAEALRDPRAWEVTEDELVALQRADLAQAEYGRDTGLADRLVAALAAVRRGTPARGFGAGERDELRSTATLFVDPDVGGRRVAVVESVGTLREHRGRGLAKAVVSAAIVAADEWGADLIVVPVDADDWPQLMYHRLGFRTIGRQVQFTRRSV